MVDVITASSFVNGEVDNSYEASPAQISACSLLTNIQPEDPFGIRTRPGSRLHGLTYKNKRCRLIPFSDYWFELVEGKIRVWLADRIHSLSTRNIASVTGEDEITFTSPHGFVVDDSLLMGFQRGLKSLPSNLHNLRVIAAPTTTTVLVADQDDAVPDNLDQYTLAHKMQQFPNTYTEAELPNIQYATFVGGVFLAHPNHPIMQLKLVGSTWTYIQPTFTAIPNNKPKAILLFENRLWCALNNRFYASKIASIFDFGITSDPNSGVDFTFNEAGRDQSLWFASFGNILILATDAAILHITGNTAEEPIDNANLNIRHIDDEGASNVIGYSTGSAVFFVNNQRDRFKLIRLMEGLNLPISGEFGLRSPAIRDIVQLSAFYQEDDFLVGVLADGKIALGRISPQGIGIYRLESQLSFYSATTYKEPLIREILITAALSGTKNVLLLHDQLPVVKPTSEYLTLPDGDLVAAIEYQSIAERAALLDVSLSYNGYEAAVQDWAKVNEVITTLSIPWEEGHVGRQIYFKQYIWNIDALIDPNRIRVSPATSFDIANITAAAGSWSLATTELALPFTFSGDIKVLASGRVSTLTFKDTNVLVLPAPANYIMVGNTFPLRMLTQPLFPTSLPTHAADYRFANVTAWTKYQFGYFSINGSAIAAATTVNPELQGERFFPAYGQQNRISIGSDVYTSTKQLHLVSDTILPFYITMFTATIELSFN